jgi:hypothetical protein
MGSPVDSLVDEHHAANSNHEEEGYLTIILSALMKVKSEIISDEWNVKRCIIR